MARFTPTDIVSQYSAISALNANFDTVATLIELCLFRDGTSPNQMLTNINMNNFKIQNLADGVDAADAVNVSQLDDLLDDVAAAQTAAEAAQAEAEAAAVSATASAAALAAATTSSGSYTPTIGTLTNLTSVIVNKATYQRNGNYVTVGFMAQFDGMAGGTNETIFEMSLPVASNLTSSQDAYGTAATQPGQVAYIAGNTTISEDNVEVVWLGEGPGGGLITGIFQYEVK
jgi:hypothetical protein